MNCAHLVWIQWSWLKYFTLSLRSIISGILCQELGIPLEQAHSALSDAQATAELFLCMRQKTVWTAKRVVGALIEFIRQLYSMNLT